MKKIANLAVSVLINTGTVILIYILSYVAGYVFVSVTEQNLWLVNGYVMALCLPTLGLWFTSTFSQRFFRARSVLWIWLKTAGISLTVFAVLAFTDFSSGTITAISFIFSSAVAFHFFNFSTKKKSNIIQNTKPAVQEGHQ